MTDVDKIVSSLRKSFASDKAIKNKGVGNTEFTRESVPYWIPTGSTLLDYAIWDGIPGGKITEISGQSATGKSALCYSMLANVQNIGGIGILLETEGSLDETFIKSFGVNLDELIITMPGSIEEIYDQTINIVNTIREETDLDVPILVCVDSIAVPAYAETEKNVEEVTQIGVAARMHRKGLRSILKLCRDQNFAFVAVNHLYSTINSYGASTDSAGGFAWKYWPSVRILLKNVVKIHNKSKNDQLDGIELKAQIQKNRFSNSHKTVPLKLHVGIGVDDIGQMIDFCRKYGMFGSGAWYEYNGKKCRRAELIKEIEGNAANLAVLKQTCKKFLI